MICLFSVRTEGQMLPGIDSLLHQVERMQVKQDDFFFRGTFPTYRRYGMSTKLKPDNSIFFSGLIAFTLKELRADLSPSQRTLSDSIIHRVVASYGHFRNVSGRPTFNFWHTSSPVIFPNAWFLNQFNESNQLPDDLDDTAILWLSMDPPDSVARLVKDLMGFHANGMQGWVRNTYRSYRHLPAYSTWFGVKMPADFDFCVLCNVLYFVCAHELSFNAHDSASVRLLNQMIVRRQYLDHAAYISPHYGRTPVLLYHISRLLASYSIPALDSLKPQLLLDARRAYSHSDNWMDSLLLSTSVLRLGGAALPPPARLNPGFRQADPTFFVASFSAYLPGLWKKLLLHNQMIKYYFSCPAYRVVLYMENLILSSKIPPG